MKRWRRRVSAGMDQAIGNVTWDKPKPPAPAVAFTQCGAHDRMWICAEAPGHLGDHAVYVDGQEVHRWPAKTPVPPLTRGGTGTIPGAGEAPPLPAPAPGHHRGHHMVIDIWECGCIHTWTRATGWAHDYDCLDEAIRKLLAP